MRKSLAILTALLMLSVFSFTALADDEKPAEEIEVGGRFMLDMAWMSGDDAIEEEFGPFEDAIEYRRARIYAKGTFFGKVEFKVQYDFAGGDADWKDVYLKIKHLPFNLTVGHFKEPFGLEELTSSKYITFIEQSLVTDTFAPSRKLGFMFDVNLADKLIWLGFGIFREPTDSYGDALNVEALYNFTGRFAITPMYNKDNGNAIHLGVAYTNRNLDGGDLRYRVRPEVHVTAHRFVDTGNMYAESSSIFGLEAAAVFGPFSVQGEFMSASVDATMVGDPVFSGFYIQASYWLTGEHRNYKVSTKEFDRVKPKKSLGQEDGIGAFELALRYSMIDLNDADITGGELNNFTVGLNWHLNPYTRIMANYVMSDHDEYGAFNCFYLRFQTDFKIKVSK